MTNDSALSTHYSSLLARLSRERTQLLPALLLAQAVFGHVSDWAVERIAAHLRLTPSDVEGVASGYPELRRRPAGERVVRVCTGLSCWTRGGDRLLAALEFALGIRVGETTPDGEVTLEETSCCFICAVAPVVRMSDDGDCLGRVTEGEARALVAAAGRHWSSA